MSDVRLVATNPEDSSIVPVAVNANGQLLLEDPVTVEGPQGPRGPEGPEGPPGEDGKDGDSFVPSPAGTKAGSVLTSDGSTCSWLAPTGSAVIPQWQYYVYADPQAGVSDYKDRKNMFDGNSQTSWLCAGSGSFENGGAMYFEMPMAFTLTKLRILFPDDFAVSGNWVVQINGKSESVAAQMSGWVEFPRFQSETLNAGDQIKLGRADTKNYEVVAWELNGQELRDSMAFNQQLSFAFEQNLVSGLIKL